MQADKQQLHNKIKHYAACMKQTERILAQEMRKLPGDRDDVLVDECLESLHYFHREADALRAERAANQERHGRAKHGFRTRPGFILLAVVLVLLLAGCVAQALGFRVWTALLHWDAGYLHVNYAPAEQAPLGSSNTGSIENENGIEGGIVEQTEYPTIEDALGNLGFAPLLPTYLPEGFAISKISGYCDETGKTLHICYENQENGQTIFYSATEINEPESATTVLLPGGEEAGLRYESNGITFIVSQADAMVCATWVHGNITYTMDSTVTDTEALRFIDALENYEK